MHAPLMRVQPTLLIWSGQIKPEAPLGSFLCMNMGQREILAGSCLVRGDMFRLRYCNISGERYQPLCTLVMLKTLQICKSR